MSALKNEIKKYLESYVKLKYLVSEPWQNAKGTGCMACLKYYDSSSFWDDYRANEYANFKPVEKIVEFLFDSKGNLVYPAKDDLKDARSYESSTWIDDNTYLVSWYDQIVVIKYNEITKTWKKFEILEFARINSFRKTSDNRWLITMQDNSMCFYDFDHMKLLTSRFDNLTEDRNILPEKLKEEFEKELREKKGTYIGIISYSETVLDKFGNETELIFEAYAVANDLANNQMKYIAKDGTITIMEGTYIDIKAQLHVLAQSIIEKEQFTKKPKNFSNQLNEGEEKQMEKELKLGEIKRKIRKKYFSIFTNMQNLRKVAENSTGIMYEFKVPFIIFKGCSYTNHSFQVILDFDGNIVYPVTIDALFYRYSYCRSDYFLSTTGGAYQENSSTLIEYNKDDDEYEISEIPVQDILPLKNSNPNIVLGKVYENGIKYLLFDLEKKQTLSAPFSSHNGKYIQILGIDVEIPEDLYPISIVKSAKSNGDFINIVDLTYFAYGCVDQDGKFSNKMIYHDYNGKMFELYGTLEEIKEQLQKKVNEDFPGFIHDYEKSLTKEQEVAMEIAKAMHY